MAKAWSTPVTPVADLPRCAYPGCWQPAMYGYGCTRTNPGIHFCDAHRPERTARPEPARDLFRAEPARDLFWRPLR